MDIEYFSKLARLSLSVEEKTKFERDFKDILSYISQLEKVDLGNVVENKTARNIFRGDEPKENDMFRGQVLIDASPDRKEGWLKVKSVFENEN